MAYQILQVKDDRVKDGKFVLLEDGQELCTFTRATFREVLDDVAHSLGRSSTWVGSILRLFLQKYPSPIKYKPNPSNPADYSLGTLIEMLKAKGYKVYKQLPLTDAQVIAYLREYGFTVSRDVSDGAKRSEPFFMDVKHRVN